MQDNFQQKNLTSTSVFYSINPFAIRSSAYINHLPNIKDHEKK